MSPKPVPAQGPTKPAPPELKVPEALAYLERISNGSASPGRRRRPDALHYAPNHVTADAANGADLATAVAAGDDRRYKE
jgi:hypothetical protein